MKKEDMKIGMKVKIKSYKKRPISWNNNGLMDHYIGKIVTIKGFDNKFVYIEEDDRYLYNGEDSKWHFRFENFEEYEFIKDKEFKIDIL